MVTGPHPHHAFVTRDLLVRPYAAGDEAAVLALVDADRIAGQPATTPQMLERALQGRSSTDAHGWGELDPPRTDVVVTPAEEVVGVVSCATRPKDGAGLVLWLHCREDRNVAEALIAHVLTVLESRTVSAFEFASALSLGLAGLPVRHRPTTRKALEAAGFCGRRLWRYLHRRLGANGPCGYPLAEVGQCAEPPGWRLSLRHTSGNLLGEATIGCPVDEIGIVWWIGVEAAHRGRGMGRALLAQCFTELGDKGAREVITYVDAAAPSRGPERDRTAANRFFSAAGFDEIDHLHSFTRRP